jgi:hypothetical protein
MTSAFPVGVLFGAVYTIVGPDGSRAVLNDPADPDFVGFLTGDDAVTGLERAGVREAADALPEADGGVHGRFLYDRLTFTLKGIIPPDGTIAQWAAKQDRLLAATDAMRGDSTLSWTSASGIGVRVRFRQQQPTRITGRRPKTFMVAGVCEASTVESSLEVASVLVPASTGVVAAGKPARSGSVVVNNVGNADAWPSLFVQGPVAGATTVRVLHSSGDLRSFTVNRLLAGGSPNERYVLEASPRRRSLSLLTFASGKEETFNAYDRLNVTGGRWPRFLPGTSTVTVEIDADPGASAPTFTFRHRHQWG